MWTEAPVGLGRPEPVPNASAAKPVPEGKTRVTIGPEGAGKLSEGLPGKPPVGAGPPEGMVPDEKPPVGAGKPPGGKVPVGGTLEEVPVRGVPDGAPGKVRIGASPCGSGAAPAKMTRELTAAIKAKSFILGLWSKLGGLTPNLYGN